MKIISSLCLTLSAFSLSCREAKKNSTPNQQSQSLGGEQADIALNLPEQSPKSAALQASSLDTIFDQNITDKLSATTKLTGSCTKFYDTKAVAGEGYGLDFRVYTPPQEYLGNTKPLIHLKSTMIANLAIQVPTNCRVVNLKIMGLLKEQISQIGGEITYITNASKQLLYFGASTQFKPGKPVTLNLIAADTCGTSCTIFTNKNNGEIPSEPEVPKANFSASVTSGVAPLNISFTNTSNFAATQWEWDFDGDGVTDSNEKNPVHSYATPGVYTVELVGKINGEEVVEAKSNYVTVSEQSTVQKRSLPKRKTFEVTAASDDADEIFSSGNTNITNTSIYLGANGSNAQLVGLRFANVNLPAGAVVDAAYLQFYSKAVLTSTTTLEIQGEKQVNSATFAASSKNISSRSLTQASVKWDVPAWNNGWGMLLPQRSVDVAAVVKEIQSLPNYVNGSPITFIIKGNGSRRIQAFDRDPYTAARLMIEYHFPSIAVNATPYADRYNNFFPLGTTASADDIGNLIKLGDKNIFRRLTPESSMKFKSMQPKQGEYTFERMDVIAKYARDHKLKITGHTFLWHQANPSWLFADGVDGSISKETLKKRLKAHIFKLVERYGDIVDNWDVANEVISPSNDSTKIYRDDNEGDADSNSKWWTYFQSPEFIKLAFEYTIEANKTYGYTPKLYYNDYNVPDAVKIEKIMTLVKYLQDFGVQIDGIGFQSHDTLNEYPISLIKAAFDKVIAKGLKIKISELDVATNPYGYSAPHSEEAHQQSAFYYQEIFDLFRSYKDHIHSVTFWGVKDDGSWLNYDWTTWDPLPAEKHDIPLLFDKNFVAKKSFYSIMEF